MWLIQTNKADDKMTNKADDDKQGWWYDAVVSCVFLVFAISKEIAWGHMIFYSIISISPDKDPQDQEETWYC